LIQLKRLILNADDYGLCESVNRGIIECMDYGIVSDLSFMVHQEEVEAAMKLLKRSGRMSTGLHINLTLGNSILGPQSNLTTSDGSYYDLRTLVKKIVIGEVSSGDILREIQSQMDILMDNGFRITHIDSHRNIHLFPRIITPLLEVLKNYGLRAFVRTPAERTRDILKFTRPNIVRAAMIRVLSVSSTLWSGYKIRIATIGNDLYNNPRMREAFIAALNTARHSPYDIIEFPIHPGYSSDALQGYDTYSIQRECEMRFLKQCKIQFENEFKLVSFDGIG
jgi:predicted glycoside hydrolase/deacetylase ChbG (UPF0249 family)